MAATMLTAGSAAARAVVRAAAVPHTMMARRMAAPAALPTKTVKGVRASSVAACEQRLPSLAAGELAALYPVVQGPASTPSEVVHRSGAERFASLDTLVDALEEEIAKWRNENDAAQRELNEEIASYHVPIAVRQLVYDTLFVDGTRRGGWRLVKNCAAAAWARVLRESPECAPAAVAGMSAKEAGKCLQRAVLSAETSYGHLSDEEVRDKIAKIPDLPDAEARKLATNAVALCYAIQQVCGPARTACPALQ